jgi:hypothetical protein
MPSSSYQPEPCPSRSLHVPSRAARQSPGTTIWRLPGLRTAERVDVDGRRTGTRNSGYFLPSVQGFREVLQTWSFGKQSKLAHSYPRKRELMPLDEPFSFLVVPKIREAPSYSLLLFLGPFKTSLFQQTNCHYPPLLRVKTLTAGGGHISSTRCSVRIIFSTHARAFCPLPFPFS